MAIDWLTHDGETDPSVAVPLTAPTAAPLSLFDPPAVEPESKPDDSNPVQADYFEQVSAEELILGFEEARLGIEQIDQWLAMAEGLEQRGLVNRSLALEARNILADFDHEASLKAYTLHPSKTRYRQALEGMSAGMMAVIAGAVLVILRVVYRIMKYLIGNNSDPVTASKIASKADPEKPTVRDIAALAAQAPDPNKQARQLENFTGALEDVSRTMIDDVVMGFAEWLDAALHHKEISDVKINYGNSDKLGIIQNRHDFEAHFNEYLKVRQTALDEHLQLRSLICISTMSDNGQYTHFVDTAVASMVDNMHQMKRQISRIYREMARLLDVGTVAGLTRDLENAQERKTDTHSAEFKQLQKEVEEFGVGRLHLDGKPVEIKEFEMLFAEERERVKGLRGQIDCRSISQLQGALAKNPVFSAMRHATRSYGHNSEILTLINEVTVMVDDSLRLAELETHDPVTVQEGENAGDDRSLNNFSMTKETSAEFSRLLRPMRETLRIYFRIYSYISDDIENYYTDLGILFKMFSMFFDFIKGITFTINEGSPADWTIKFYDKRLELEKAVAALRQEFTQSEVIMVARFKALGGHLNRIFAEDKDPDTGKPIVHVLPPAIDKRLRKLARSK